MASTPCSWPVNRTGFPALPTVDDPPLAGQQDAYDLALDNQLAVEDLAVTILWALSGRQFGVCEVQERPVPIEHQPGEVGGGLSRMWPYRPNLSRTIINDWSGLFGRRTGSRLNGPSMVTLPGPAQPHSARYPTVVEIGGCDDGPEILVPGDDYVIQDNVLFRTGGKVWPFQDLGRPLGECCTWSVTYWKGVPPPRGTAYLVGLLALELLLARKGDPKCRLPKSVTRMARNGVNYELDPLSLYAVGKIGIPEVDSWLASVNPKALMQPPSVL